MVLIDFEKLVFKKIKIHSICSQFFSEKLHKRRGGKFNSIYEHFKEMTIS